VTLLRVGKYAVSQKRHLFIFVIYLSDFVRFC